MLNALHCAIVTLRRGSNPKLWTKLEWKKHTVIGCERYALWQQLLYDHNYCHWCQCMRAKWFLVDLPKASCCKPWLQTVITFSICTIQWIMCIAPFRIPTIRTKTNRKTKNPYFVSVIFGFSAAITLDSKFITWNEYIQSSHVIYADWTKTTYSMLTSKNQWTGIFLRWSDSESGSIIWCMKTKMIGVNLLCCCGYCYCSRDKLLCLKM